MAQTPDLHGDTGEPVLVYDRIATNKRETWFMMLIFVIVLGAFASVIGYVVGLPWQAAPFVFVALGAYAMISYYASAGVALAVSGACCVLSVALYGRYPAVVMALALVWGVFVIADSAQFSAALTELTDVRYTGTALTAQLAIGFLVTVGSIRLAPWLAGEIGRASCRERVYGTV